MTNCNIWVVFDLKKKYPFLFDYYLIWRKIPSEIFERYLIWHTKWYLPTPKPQSRGTEPICLCSTCSDTDSCEDTLLRRIRLCSLETGFTLRFLLLQCIHQLCQEDLPAVNQHLFLPGWGPPIPGGGAPKEPVPGQVCFLLPEDGLGTLQGGDHHGQAGKEWCSDYHGSEPEACIWSHLKELRYRGLEGGEGCSSCQVSAREGALETGTPGVLVEREGGAGEGGERHKESDSDACIPCSTWINQFGYLFPEMVLTAPCIYIYIYPSCTLMHNKHYYYYLFV